jgi:hypothetical protein
MRMIEAVPCKVCGALSRGGTHWWCLPFLRRRRRT